MQSRPIRRLIIEFRLQRVANTHGWFNLPQHALISLGRKLRDRLWARQLHAPGFRTARSPRILGGSALHLGPDFHARDFLWLEAIAAYTGGGNTTCFNPEIHIGRSARLSDNVHIACINRITIGDHLLCGSGVLISDHAHGSYRGNGRSTDPTASDPAIPPAQRALASSRPVRIGDNVWLGDGVAVLPGAVIGDGCVVGANSVVTGTIPPRTLAVGAPARPIRRWSEDSRSWLSLTGSV